MGSLTRYLQDGFAKHCPSGWTARAEVPLLDSTTQDALGFAPRADVLLERQDQTRRIWVEFEVSRADPVANHAKFATAHMFEPSLSGDIFLSMVSTHVVRGRRNLAAAMAGVMRRLGIRAFQTVLLPGIPPEGVKALNHEDPETLLRHGPSVAPEVARAIRASEEVLEIPGVSVHFASDALDVLLNLRRWNEDLTDGRFRDAWRRRPIRYFAHDPWTGLFAPSKFCAYLPIATGAPPPPAGLTGPLGGMTIPLYCEIDALAPGFDGSKAWRHLAENLGFTLEQMRGSTELADTFSSWHAGVADSVPVRVGGPTILSPPAWLR